MIIKNNKMKKKMMTIFEIFLNNFNNSIILYIIIKISIIYIII